MAKNNKGYSGKTYVSDVNKIQKETLLKVPSITIMPRMFTDAYIKGKTLRNSMLLKGAIQA